jgi:PKD repeat protein
VDAVRRIAIGLAVLVFIASGVTMAQATGWGGSSYPTCDAACIQYKKKKFCDLILWLYKYKSSYYKSSTSIYTDYGWHTIEWLIKFCLDDDKKDPIAKCSASPNPVYKYKTVTWSGAGSSDPDGGSIVKYEWDFNGDNSFETTGQTVTKTYSSTGTKYATLRVTDDEGDTAKTTCSVYVKSYY